MWILNQKYSSLIKNGTLGLTDISDKNVIFGKTVIGPEILMVLFPDRSDIRESLHCFILNENNRF